VTYSLTTGNSSSTTFGLAATSSYQAELWRSMAHAEYLQAKADGRLAAQQRMLRLETERNVYDGVGVVGRLSHAQDRFADSRGLNTAELGAGWRMYEKEGSRAELNATLAWANENHYVARSRTYLATRWVLTATHQLNSAVHGDIETDVLVDLSTTENWKSRSTVSISAALTKLFTLKTAAKVMYSNLPADGKKRTDCAVTAALVVQWPAAKP
jgi:putative salt-induced outer membrane protein YdiY